MPSPMTETLDEGAEYLLLQAHQHLPTHPDVSLELANVVYHGGAELSPFIATHAALVGVYAAQRLADSKEAEAHWKREVTDSWPIYREIPPPDAPLDELIADMRATVQQAIELATTPRRKQLVHDMLARLGVVTSNQEYLSVVTPRTHDV